MPEPIPRLTKAHYVRLAAWRQALRRFQRFSREAALAAGVTPQQHQAMLAIKGFPGRDYVSIGELAERLHLRHHSAVGLIDRLAGRGLARGARGGGLARRARAAADRRRAEVRLTSQGHALIRRLSAAHLQELRQLSPELRRLLGSVGEK